MVGVGRLAALVVATAAVVAAVADALRASLTGGGVVTAFAATTAFFVEICADRAADIAMAVGLIAAGGLVVMFTAALVAFVAEIAAWVAALLAFTVAACVGTWVARIVGT